MTISSTCHLVIIESVTMTSIVIGEIGSAVATGMGTIGIEIIPGAIGPDKRFIGHHQATLVTEDLMGSQSLEGLEDHMENQVVRGMVDLRVSQVDLDHMENQVDQELVARRVSRVDLDHMENQVDQELVARRVSRVVPVEVDLILKCMEDQRAMQVDLDPSLKWLEDRVEVDLIER